jgi:hypothetical protein
MSIEFINLFNNDYYVYDYSKDLFKFYERLGNVLMILCKDRSNKIIGTSCSINRKIPNMNNQIVDVWYICSHSFNDIKYSLDLINKYIHIGSYNNYRGYGILMNEDYKKNKLLKSINKIPNMKLKYGGILLIYSLDYITLYKVLPLITKYKGGNIYYLSLNGIKDKVMKSTYKSVDILHLQYGYCSDHSNSLNKPLPDYLHMFCCLNTESLVYELAKKGVYPIESGSIIHNNMDDMDWRFILTSDL